MLKDLIENCKKLENGWDRESFPKSARLLLESFNLESSLESFENQIADWLETNELPKQLNLYNNFGEPSLSLFNNGKFAIDVYFWRKNDTLIHSHGFRGAFKILHGVSLHEEFKVETTKKFGEDLLKTNLSQKKIHIMKRGDVQQINPDMELTHRVVHLDNPTVSLCLRTVEDVSLNQWHHLTTGLSFQKKHISEKTIKKNLYFQYLLSSDQGKAEDFYLKLINELKAAERISLYEGLYLGEIGLDVNANEIAANLLYDKFQAEEWFELYEDHFDNLQKNFFESSAKSPELKLLAHSINNHFSRKQTEALLVQFSDKKVPQLLEELKREKEIFSLEFKDIQLDKINKF